MKLSRICLWLRGVCLGSGMEWEISWGTFSNETSVLEDKR